MAVRDKIVLRQYETR